MSVDGLPRMIPSSTQVLASISDWGARLVAPLEAPLVSKDGMLEIAGRTYWIFALVIAAVIVARKYGYLTGRAIPPDSPPTNAKRVSMDSPTLPGNIDADAQPDGEDFVTIEQLEQLEKRIARLERECPLIAQRIKTLDQQLK